jgi:hypothetical protein
MALLLCCASPAGERAERIRDLSDQVLDWDYLLGLAAAHRLTPLLYRGLKAIRPELISDSLARSFQDNTRNSVFLIHELFELMELFGHAGISVLPFKGPTLASMAFGNIGLREFVDLDLLVHRKDALHARDILLENGYITGLQLRPKWHQAYLRAYDEFVLRGPTGLPMVELHWEVAPRYFSVSFDPGPVWGRATSVNLANREIPTFCAEDLLILLCLHGTKHCWPRLSMVSDIAWLIAGRNIRWGDVLERSRAAGTLRMTLLGVELAGQLFDTLLPQEVLCSIAADPGVKARATEVTARMLQSRGLDGILRAGFFHMLCRERWQDRTRYIARLATTVGVEDWQWFDLPSGFGFLYSVLRFPRLLRKYWLRIP